MLGAGAGLLATPLLAAGFMFGHTQLRSALDWPPVALFAATALLAGVLAGSRLSPLASLLPGLVLTALAAAATAGLDAYYTGLVPDGYLANYQLLVHLGAPVAGCALLAASLFPSRWRGRPRAVPAAEEPPPPPVTEEETPAPPPLPKRIPSRY
ncbi:hypothetical protein MF672_011790 [Actinomadura sp. ATCC 31491]|uniref:Uncharacterized protein n=1 Tax=Actinomadura luzonensis TaxID=2805427 RepID=A0ABT0FQ53_9ACTN|nr:hypothetical protein [Actinomadura luzonensis]MCK2214465.1 hypothetical protein [Actinomadura luzonensis]